MNIGMLWAGKNILEAKNYYIKKYKREPDTIEMSNNFSELLGIEKSSKIIDGMNLKRSNKILTGCLFIGIETDFDLSNYNITTK